MFLRESFILWISHCSWKLTWVWGTWPLIDEAREEISLGAAKLCLVVSWES